MPVKTAFNAVLFVILSGMTAVSAADGQTSGPATQKAPTFGADALIGTWIHENRAGDLLVVTVLRPYGLCSTFVVWGSLEKPTSVDNSIVDGTWEVVSRQRIMERARKDDWGSGKCGKRGRTGGGLD